MASNKIVIKMEAKNLLKKLRELPDQTQDKVIKKSVRKGANTIRQDARTNVPVDTGYMKKKIQVKQAKKTSQAGQFVMIVNVNSPAHHLIELGTKDRKPNKSRVLVFENKNGELIYVKEVKGIKPNPFLGKAYESNKDNVFEIFKSELLNQLKKMGL